MILFFQLDIFNKLYYICYFSNTLPYFKPYFFGFSIVIKLPKMRRNTEKHLRKYRKNFGNLKPKSRNNLVVLNHTTFLRTFRGNILIIYQ